MLPMAQRSLPRRPVHIWHILGLVLRSLAPAIGKLTFGRPHTHSLRTQGRIPDIRLVELCRARLYAGAHFQKACGTKRAG